MKVSGNIKKFFHYAYPMQTALVTCLDGNDKTNVITIAWHTPISKKPPLYGISIAPGRYSHDLIKKSGEFVINFSPYHLVEKINFCGTHSGRKTDKISETNLTLTPSKKIKTSAIEECFAHFECKLYGSFIIGDHTLFIGEVINILIDDNAFLDDLIETKKIQPCYYIGDNIYTRIGTEKKKIS